MIKLWNIEYVVRLKWCVLILLVGVAFMKVVLMLLTIWNEKLWFPKLISVWFKNYISFIISFPLQILDSFHHVLTLTMLIKHMTKASHVKIVFVEVTPVKFITCKQSFISSFSLNIYTFMSQTPDLSWFIGLLSVYKQS